MSCPQGGRGASSSGGPPHCAVPRIPCGVWGGGGRADIVGPQPQALLHPEDSDCSAWQADNGAEEEMGGGGTGEGGGAGEAPGMRGVGVELRADELLSKAQFAPC